MTSDWDLVLVGGGLANALIAWRVRQQRPGLRVLVLERGARLGGNHTWSFFATDVTSRQRAWLEPLVVARWPGYTVRFSGLARRLTTPYASIASVRLHQVVSAALGNSCWCGVEVTDLTSTEVSLSDGRTVRAAGVIDGRGAFDSPHLALAYQKFAGIDVRLDRPHGLELPIIMDGSVEQADGFRFLYVLPLDPTRLLVEDTRYSDSTALDIPAVRRGIAEYMTARGWDVRAELRGERGVLPVALAGDIDAFWTASRGVPRSGLGAALFHPTTGYSLADAAAVADMVAELPDLCSPRLLAAVRDRSRRLWASRAHFRMLNRMLFRAGEPAARHRVFRRFYTLSQPLIERFYAGRPTPADRLRLLAGRPPVPVLPALRCVPEGSWLRRESFNA